jgi:hypothetical protein
LVLEHTEVTIELPDRTSDDCRAVGSVLARVGDKWSVQTIVLLGDGPKRFNEIKRMIGGISTENAHPHASRIRAGRLGEANTIPDDPSARGL